MCGNVYNAVIATGGGVTISKKKRPRGFTILAFVFALLAFIGFAHVWAAVVNVVQDSSLMIIGKFLYGASAFVMMVGLWRVAPWVGTVAWVWAYAMFLVVVIILVEHFALDPLYFGISLLFFGTPVYLVARYINRKLETH